MKNRNTHISALISILALLLAAALLAACSNAPAASTATPAATATAALQATFTATPAVNPTIVVMASPSINVSPNSGGADTRVEVSGQGFPAKAQVFVRLGTSATGLAKANYAEAQTDASGSFSTSFVMPGTWPDGLPITETEIVVAAVPADGSVQAEATFQYTAVSGPETVVFTWHREGGFAGYCEDMAVNASGAVTVTSCKDKQPEVIARGDLSQEQLQQLRDWHEAYASFRFEHSDKAKADAMTMRITFTGLGEQEATEAVQQEMFDFLNAVFSGLF